MAEIKIPPKRWLRNILSALAIFSDPVQGLITYEFSKMYTFYCNYVDYGGAQLEDMLFYEFLDDGYALKYGSSEVLLAKLKSLKLLIERFYQSVDNLSNFEVIRCKEWDEIVPLAQECYKGLEQLCNKMPKDPED